MPFIIDHMGRVPTKNGLDQPPFQALLKLAQTNEKCWVKISGAERISSDGPAVHRCRAVRAGAHRGGAGPLAVGHRLAASEYREAHAE